MPLTRLIQTHTQNVSKTPTTPKQHDTQSFNRQMNDQNALPMKMDGSNGPSSAGSVFPHHNPAAPPSPLIPCSGRLSMTFGEYCILLQPLPAAHMLQMPISLSSYFPQCPTSFSRRVSFAHWFCVQLQLLHLGESIF